MRLRLTALLLIFGLLLAGPVRAADLPPPLRFESWQKVYTPLDLRSFTHLGDRYWGVIGNGDLYSSTDGDNWKMAVAAPKNVLVEELFTFAGQLFGKSKAGLYRLDGDHWTSATPQAAAYFIKGDRLVVWGTTAWQSRDGKTWDQFTLPDSWKVYDRDPAFWQVVGSRDGLLGWGSKGLARSTNGDQWQEAPLLPGLVVHGIAGSDQGFVVMATDGPSLDPGKERFRILFSKDGQNWEEVRRLPWARLAPDGSNQVAYWHLQQEEDGGVHYRLNTFDGANWTQERFPLEATPTDGIWTVGSERWVAVDGALYRARAGQDWRRVGPFAGFALRGIAFGPAGWVAAGSNGSLLYSADGQQWTQAEPPRMGGYQWVTYQRDRYYALLLHAPVSDCPFDVCEEELLSSTDGRTWSAISLPRGTRWNLVAHDSILYAAADAQGVWSGSSSTDLRRLPSSPQGRVMALASFHEHLYAIVWTDDATRLVQLMPDGSFKTVTERLPAKEGHLVVLGDQLVAYGANGLTTSQDGIKWSDPILTKKAVVGVVPMGNGFLTVDVESSRYGGMTAFAGPGFTNPSYRSASFFEPLRVAQGKGEYVAVGYGGIWHWAPPPLCQGAFKDLPASNPACQAAEFLQKRLVVGGYPDGTFGPERGVTRAEFAKMLVLAKGWSPSPGAPLAFGDVTGHWAATGGFLQAAVGAKALNGFPDGSFQPDGPVTRGQLIKMVVGGVGGASAAASPYRDVAADQWYAPSVAGAITLKLVGAGAPLPLWTAADLEPDRPVTRAEAAIILFNLLNR